MNVEASFKKKKKMFVSKRKYPVAGGVQFTYVCRDVRSPIHNRKLDVSGWSIQI